MLHKKSLLLVMAVLLLVALTGTAFSASGDEGSAETWLNRAEIFFYQAEAAQEKERLLKKSGEYHHKAITLDHP